MNHDQPTRDLYDEGDDGDDVQPTVELRRRPERETQVIPDETQRIPDDLVPDPGATPPLGHRDDLTDTQPIDLRGRHAWERRRPQPQPPPAQPAPAPRRRGGRWRSQPPGWDRQPDAWRQPEPPPGWDQAGPGWQQPPAAPGWGPLPPAGRSPGQHGGARRRQSLLVWVFTVMVALGMGATAVLGPWAEPLGLTPQASALLVIVVSLVAWVLLSAALRLVGIVAFVLTPLLFLAGSVPELRRLPVELPRIGGAATLLAMTLGITCWLAGHWFFYARKGWWRSRVAGAVLGAIPGVEETRGQPE